MPAPVIAAAAVPVVLHTGRALFTAFSAARVGATGVRAVQGVRAGQTAVKASQASKAVAPSKKAVAAKKAATVGSGVEGGRQVGKATAKKAPAKKTAKKKNKKDKDGGKNKSSTRVRPGMSAPAAQAVPGSPATSRGFGNAWERGI